MKVKIISKPNQNLKYVDPNFEKLKLFFFSIMNIILQDSLTSN